MANPTSPAPRRRNLPVVLAVLALVTVLAAGPALFRAVTSPTRQYETYAEAQSAGHAETLPPLVPPRATRIYFRRDPRTGTRFVRFNLDRAEMPALTAGLRRLELAEVERLAVPQTGFSWWWLVSSRTLSGSQGERLEVFQVPRGRGGGWLAVDPRTFTAYHWGS